MAFTSFGETKHLKGLSLMTRNVLSGILKDNLYYPLHEFSIIWLTLRKKVYKRKIHGILKIMTHVVYTANLTLGA